MPEKIQYGTMDAPIIADNGVSVYVPDFDKLAWRSDAKGRNSTARAEIKFSAGSELVTPTGEHITKAQLVLVKTDEQYLAEKRQAAINRMWREFATAFKDLSLGQMQDFYVGKIRLQLITPPFIEGSKKAGKKVLREHPADSTLGVTYEDLPSIYSVEDPAKRVDSNGKAIKWTKEKVDAMVEAKQGGITGVKREDIEARIKLLSDLVNAAKSEINKGILQQAKAEAEAALKKFDKLAKMRVGAKAALAKKAEQKEEIPFPSTRELEERREALGFVKTV